MKPLQTFIKRETRAKVHEKAKEREERKQRGDLRKKKEKKKNKKEEANYNRFRIRKSKVVESLVLALRERRSSILFQIRP